MGLLRFSTTRGTLAALTLLGLAALPQAAQAVTLFNNGTLITGTGNGFGGANTSAVIAPITNFGLTTTNINANGNFRVADDFTVAGGTWDLTSLHWYAYVTNTTAVSSPFTGAFVTVFSGTPGAGGTVVAGDFTTNRLTSSTFSNIYRVSSSTGPTNNARPIYDLNIDMSWVPDLTPGTYWLEVGLATTTPTAFTPLRNLVGGTANVRQHNIFTNAWVDADVSSTAGTQLGETSFQLEGNIVTAAAAPEPGTLALVALGIAGGVVARRRRK